MSLIPVLLRSSSIRIPINTNSTTTVVGKRCLSLLSSSSSPLAATTTIIPSTTIQQQQQQNQNHNIFNKNLATRNFSSSYSLDRSGGGGGGRGGGNGGGGRFDFFGGGGGTGANLLNWPITKMNTILNIVPQGEKHVVERLGKLHSIQESGFFLAIPIVDRVAYIVDIRERALDIAPQAAITRDNVSVEVSGNLFIRVLDVEKAAYGSTNPLYAVSQHAQSAMRSAIGEMELDEILHNRAKLNTLIGGTLQEASIPWGLEIRRYEITEVTPDQQIRIAMDKQAAAERDRREQVLRAEGDKRRAELTSEGVKIKLTNESEGEYIKIKNEANATREKLLLEAQGQSEAVKLMADAQALAISKISQELQKPGGQQAAQLSLANEYVKMYGEMGSKSNTMIFNNKPADVSALLTQAVAAMNAIPSNTNKQKGGSSIDASGDLLDADHSNSNDEDDKDTTTTNK